METRIPQRGSDVRYGSACRALSLRVAADRVVLIVAAPPEPAERVHVWFESTQRRPTLKDLPPRCRNQRESRGVTAKAEIEGTLRIGWRQGPEGARSASPGLLESNPWRRLTISEHREHLLPDTEDISCRGAPIVGRHVGMRQCIYRGPRSSRTRRSLQVCRQGRSRRRVGRSGGRRRQSSRGRDSGGLSGGDRQPFVHALGDQQRRTEAEPPDRGRSS